MKFRATVLALASGTALLAAAFAAPVAYGHGSTRAGSWGGGNTGYKVNCATGLCMELNNQSKEQAYGNKYVGHDEPSVLFYSNQRNSGDQMEYHLVLPRDPSPTQPGASFNFELRPAFWFGLAMCASKSFPEQVKTCKADSNSNIQPAAKHPGAAYMEMQFYPPGGVPKPFGFSCDPTRWCSALTIDSYAVDPINGTTLNASCATTVGGLEYSNFAFVTKHGHAQGPANPITSDLATYTPDPKRTLFMNPGDSITVKIRDVYTREMINGHMRENLPSDGLRIDVYDTTAGTHGWMTASKDNGFGQVAYKTDPSRECRYVPYNFHPMYNTSTPQTVVPWAAHTYNVAYSDEVGHFDLCYPDINSFTSSVDPGGFCPSDYLEGPPSDASFADNDDGYCFPAGWFMNPPTAIDFTGTPLANGGPAGANSSPFGGCFQENDPGFDGLSYQRDWPDGNTTLHPTPVLFTSPTTGGQFKDNYSQAGFQTDLPAVEQYPTCSHRTGAGCSLLPTSDDESPAAFYPYFSTGKVSGQCWWAEGASIPGFPNDYGKNAQYGSLLAIPELLPGGGGAYVMRYEDFNNTLSNPCPAGGTTTSSKR